ncbi:sensor histidine kinase KdpD [Hymenobacter sp. BT559]|uniref:sensor histidine kinase n=1 Tax=Hymenobacter sp. BT559 TaxID=2795729 RepID=UPI0018EB96B2|nr:HAMP domain-containing sensor histidine kinase [Hymenobacter sp. BT559]MBJ6145060.1 HAMP domain-containing histidine kinase [Hymenobacter sp. BT559]
MKSRLRFIFSLLASCLLGIYGFQAYWLYGSYQLATTQFGRSTSEALEAVVQRQQVRRTNKMFNIKFNNYADASLPPGQASRWQIEKLDTGLTAPQAARPWPRPAQPPRVLVLRSSAASKRSVPNAQVERTRAARTDSLARQLSSFVISNWYRQQPVDLGQLALAYRTELRQREIATDFKLDTVSNTTISFKAHVPGVRDTVLIRMLPNRAGYPVHTLAVSLNPVRGLAVGASFPAPRAYVLRHMTGSLAGSAVLLGLTTGCFALMLSTILRQKKLAEVKNDFINNMTHELKTPLATVSAAMEALQDFGALGDARKTDTYLTMARQEVRRLSDLVEKVLHIAVEDRPGHALALRPETVRLAALVAELVSRHELQAPKPVQFEVNIAPAATLLLDRLHLAGALHNLLDNAIKYSGERVTIRIGGQLAAGGYQLSVADDGPGIAPGYQDAIFEQFFRVPTGNLHPVKGFGLGLYYVRQVVAGHGGRVSVRSTPGRGSEFIIWLPDSVID